MFPAPTSTVASGFLRVRFRRRYLVVKGPARVQAKRYKRWCTSQADFRSILQPRPLRNTFSNRDIHDE